MNQTEATAEHLAYVNDAGKAILRVDNTTNVPDGQNRNTVCLLSSSVDLIILKNVSLGPDYDEGFL